MSGYSVLSPPRPAPPRASELVPACVAHLSADAELQNALGAAGRIYAQRQPDPGDRPARLVVVRIPTRYGGLRENVARAVRAPLQVMVETKTGHVADIERFHAAAHDRIHDLLAGFAPELDHASIGVPVERHGQPGAVAYDADDDADYSTAEYSAVLEPLPVTP